MDSYEESLRRAVKRREIAGAVFVLLVAPFFQIFAWAAVARHVGVAAGFGIVVLLTWAQVLTRGSSGAEEDDDDDE